MKNAAIFSVFAALLVAGCAETTVQQMSKDTFKVDTMADPACGPQGARNVAFRTAAIEVIRRGGDKFIIVGDNAKYDGWSGVHGTSMVIRMVSPTSQDAKRALSAREVLGADWQSIVAKGAPNTCTE